MIQHLPILAIMTYFLGAFLITLLGHNSKAVRHFLVLLASAVSFVMMCVLIKPVMIDGGIIGYWLGGRAPEAGYAIGIGIEVDALSLFFGLLVTFTVLLSAVYSIKYISRDDAQDKYYTLFLMLAGGVLGLVLSGDLFNIFIMVEIMTFAAVALTAYRNWAEGSLESAFKYLAVGSIGSSMILAGTIMVYSQVHTLNLAQISALLAGQGLTNTTVFAFALLFIGFGVKAFIVPFHPIAADAYMTAPASVSMVFSGMVNKAGVYGMIRLVYVVFQIMDVKSVNYLIVLLGTVTMFIGVTSALNQHDFKRLLAFHSISQIGYVITAIGLATSLGIAGGLYHAMNHTLFKGLLFLAAGAVFYSAGTTDLDRLGGLAKRMPQTAAIFLVGAAAISGIPPFNGFASKWVIYQACYEAAAAASGFASIFYAVVTIVGLLVSVMTLASFIKVSQSVFFGQLPDEFDEVKEAPLLMRIPMWIMAICCLLAGLLPGPLSRFALQPAAAATLNIKGYIDTMMGGGYAASQMGEVVPVAELDFSTIGYWQPVAWLVLFVIIMAAVLIVALGSQGARGNKRSTELEKVDGKYATFFGGEHSTYSMVGGSDLFWGLRYNLRHYFGFLSDMHSGVVNDYALWAVTAAAGIILYMFLFL